MLVVECKHRDIDIVASVEHSCYVHRFKATVSIEHDHVAGLPIDRMLIALVEIGIHFGIMQWVRRWPAAIERPARIVPVAVVLHERSYPHLLTGARGGRLPQERLVQLVVVFAFVVVQRGKVLGVHTALERIEAWFYGLRLVRLRLFGLVHLIGIGVIGVRRRRHIRIRIFSVIGRRFISHNGMCGIRGFTVQGDVAWNRHSIIWYIDLRIGRRELPHLGISDRSCIRLA